MKWFIGVMAALLTTAAQAQVVNVNVAADSGNSCAIFQGSFTREGWRGVHQAKPSANCTLIEGVGFRCRVVNHGVDSLPAVLGFEGNFGWENGIFKLEGEGHRVLAIRMLCKSTDNCYQLQIWNTDSLFGFGCDMHKFVVNIPKPAPRPPELLRKPEAKDAPPAFKPLEDGTYKL